MSLTSCSWSPTARLNLVANKSTVEKNATAMHALQILFMRDSVAECRFFTHVAVLCRSDFYSPLKSPETSESSKLFELKEFTRDKRPTIVRLSFSDRFRSTNR